MHTKKMLENAHKFVYLVEAYPEKNVGDVIGLFRLSPIDINCAIWVALEKKWLEIDEREEEVETPNPAKPTETIKKVVPVQYFKVLQRPKVWDFGADVQELEDNLDFAFGKLNAEEKDLEENYLNNWLGGYAPQDVLIAVKHLIEENILHEYQIEDGDSNYIFYTLKENEGKNWGAKQFKTNPLTGEPNEAEKEEPADDAKAEE